MKLMKNGVIIIERKCVIDEKANLFNEKIFIEKLQRKYSGEEKLIPIPSKRKK